MPPTFDEEAAITMSKADFGPMPGLVPAVKLRVEDHSLSKPIWRR